MPGRARQTLNSGSAAIRAFYLALAVALMAAMLVSFILTPSWDDLPLVIVAAVMSMAAFLAVRNITVAVIAICAPLARHLPLALERRWPAIATTRELVGQHRAPTR